ncbi:Polycomb group protein FIE1 [Clarias magur]|uniref:Polycomb group protein FIE1 n=1 Tax=Clarias magur TaxID=1594786 RepID=A0A8J4X2Y1_CLAMG|nr:Polycomb group protein FIE1 [Clarias magur]
MTACEKFTNGGAFPHFGKERSVPLLGLGCEATVPVTTLTPERRRRFGWPWVQSAVARRTLFSLRELTAVARQPGCWQVPGCSLSKPAACVRPNGARPSAPVPSNGVKSVQKLFPPAVPVCTSSRRSTVLYQFDLLRLCFLQLLHHNCSK